MMTKAERYAKRFLRTVRDNPGWVHQVPDEWIDLMTDAELREFNEILAQSVQVRKVRNGWEAGQ